MQSFAFRGCHVYSETNSSNAKVGGKVKVEIESNLESIATYPYSCVIKTKEIYFIGWKTVGYNPRKIFLSKKKVVEFMEF